MTLTVNGPAGKPHDPFAGAVRDDGAELSLPLDRYTAVGADEATLDDLTVYFDSLTRREQREAVAWHEEQTDEELGASLARFVEARDAFVALGELSDEQRAELEALSDEDREALGEYAAALEELAGLSDEDRAALVELAAASTPPADSPDGAPAGEQTPEGDSGPQNGAEPLFATKQIGDLTIGEVDALIQAGTVTAAEALTAELARGDQARSTLVDKLTKATSE